MAPVSFDTEVATACVVEAGGETMANAEFIPPSSKFVALPKRFPMVLGGELSDGRVAYEVWGRPNRQKDNLIAILGGLSADAHAASNPSVGMPGWWEEMLGPGRPIDTDRWCVLCLSFLGSCKGSTGPASKNPATGEPYGLQFPELCIEDIADSAAYALRELGFEHVACLIGASMGGMVSTSLLSRYPGQARSHINISGAIHASPAAIAFRSLQREMILQDPLWNKGDYYQHQKPLQGMVSARKLGMITYRSPQEWDSRFGRSKPPQSETLEPQKFTHFFCVESYLQRCAERFSSSFDPNCYLYLSRSMDRFDLADAHSGDVELALSQLQLEHALVIGVSTDMLFPAEQQRQIACGIGRGGANSQFVLLDTPHGHDAFLVDFQTFGPLVSDFLSMLRGAGNHPGCVVRPCLPLPAVGPRAQPLGTRHQEGPPELGLSLSFQQEGAHL